MSRGFSPASGRTPGRATVSNTSGYVEVYANSGGHVMEKLLERDHVVVRLDGPGGSLN